MKLKDMPKVELEVLSYTDLTYMLLKEKKKNMNTPSIFKEICKLLEYSDEEYSAKIGDYYTTLTLDKRFVLLDSGDWGLREKTKVELLVDEEEEETIDEEIEEEEIEENIDDDNNDDDLEDDDTMDLSIVTEDELDEEE
jgi:DNA-directed RNA polymerase, delta subunit